MPPLRFKAPNTLQQPYKPRNDTKFSHTEEEWERHKKLILQLRKKERVSNMVDILGGFGFLTSEPQLKYHLKKWGDKKYLKLTDAQIEFIAAQIAERAAAGQKSAVRINGKKQSSKGIGAILSRRPDILEKVTKNGDQGTENGDKEGLVDNESEFLTGSLASAPTIIDSLRITVYTSSTYQGVRGALKRLTKRSPESTETSSLSTSILSRFEEIETVKDVKQPIFFKKFIYSFDCTPVISLQFSVEPEPPSEGTWAALREEVFGFGRCSTITSLAVLAFEPRFVLHTATSKRFFVISENALRDMRDSIVPHLIPPSRCHDAMLQAYMVHVAKAGQEFKKFLDCHSPDRQLFRRVIDVNDCPEDVWAVDVVRFVPWQRGQYWYNGLGTYLDNAEAVDWTPSSEYDAEDFRTNSRYCLAWCTRRAHDWKEWVSALADSRRFSCGHDGRSLKADGPVIFTNTLRGACWQKNGCQWDRIAKWRTGVLESKWPWTADIYLSWSARSWTNPATAGGSSELEI